tara:strand:+ start:26808 stop:27806 length:999 start_codon:yes stop_codon:yes gene_type:complete
MFNNKSILITGGTGSFGRALSKTLLSKYNVKKLIIFSRDEAKQMSMFQEFSKYKKKLRFFIGDVRDRARLTLAFRSVDFVFHAAALKQVPTAEYNPMECIKTNIHGAENVIHASLDCNVKKIIALSTDKAVNPVNLYGATKLASDKLFIAANNMAGNHLCKFSVVRYGNVSGSTGSIIPFFRSLIKKKSKHLTITHKNMTRFWILLDESVKFVINSMSKMSGGEIFVPIIPSIKITDLATAMAPKLKQKIIGIRAGEKLHEVMCPKDEAHLVRKFNNYYIIFPSIQFINSSNIKNNLIITGKKVEGDFEYNSKNNKHFLKVNEIKKLLKKIN